LTVTFGRSLATDEKGKAVRSWARLPIENCRGCVRII